MTISTHSFDAVYVTATDTAGDSGDLIKVKDLSLSRGVNMADVTALGDANQTSIPTTGTITISLSGSVPSSSDAFDALKSGFMAKTKLFVEIETNALAAVGDEKRVRYPVYVDSFNYSFAVGSEVTFDASFVLAPGAITVTNAS